MLWDLYRLALTVALWLVSASAVGCTTESSFSSSVDQATTVVSDIRDNLLTHALDTASAPGTCGQSSAPLDTQGLLSSTTSSLIDPILQSVRDASYLLTALPHLSGSSTNPMVLGILWTSLFSKALKAPVGMAYFEAEQGVAWLLYNSDIQPSKFSLTNNISIQTTEANHTLIKQHLELASNLRNAVFTNGSNSDIIWSVPFWDCRLLDWVLSASVRVTGRGSLALLFPLQHVDIDQCNSEDSMFRGTDKCDPVSTQCVFQPGMGFRSGGYECHCAVGFFNPKAASTWRSFPGSIAELNLASCLKCPAECSDCKGGSEGCEARLNPTFRATLFGIQAVSMGITLGLAFVVFQNRKSKPIATGMWTILETILFGTLLLYMAVVIRFFKPSIKHCLLETWCRELGFVICYGAIILKLYKILIEFRTRKAHRWVVRDKDLLKYLLAMVLIAVGYLAAHTATALHILQEKPDALLALGQTRKGIHFSVCRPLWWDYVTQIGEMGMVFFGFHLSIVCRNAASQYQERLFLCVALFFEAAVSGSFYVLRAMIWQHLHPDMAFLVFVARSQLTNTVVLLLLFVPKWWYNRQYNQQRPSPSPRLQIGPFTGEGVVPASPALGTYVDADFPEISLADMPPEDIRAELKRLYTQLEVLKNKTIRADNPHISKRRGGRKVAHRRFSLQQALHHRQRSANKHAEEVEVSRTPEDSVCSIEGPSAIYNDGPSVAYSEAGFPTTSSRK